MKTKDIIKEIDLEKFAVQLEDNCIMVVDIITYKLKRLFILDPSDNEYMEMDLDVAIEKIVDYLKDKVSIADLLREFFKSQASVDEILEISERITHKPSVRQGPCFSLLIGGKPGRPYELLMVRNRGADE